MKRSGNFLCSYLLSLQVMVMLEQCFANVTLHQPIEYNNNNNNNNNNNKLL